MKTNTIKIFGILAAVLMVTVAFTPLSTFATQLSKDESLGSTPSGNDYSGSSSDADSTPSKSPCSACSPEKPDDEEQEELDRGEESTGSEIADNERQNEDGTDQIPVEQKAIDFPKPPRIMNPYILGGSSDSEKHIIALRLLLSKGLPPSDRFIDKLGDLYDIVDDGDNGVAFGGGGRGGGGLDDNEAGEKVDPDDFHNLHNKYHKMIGSSPAAKANRYRRNKARLPLRSLQS